MRKGCRDLLEHYPELEYLGKELEETINVLVRSYQDGKKIFVCGNGGSASDCLHIAGELMKGFIKKRSLSEKQTEELVRVGMDRELCGKLQNGIPTISLTGQDALNTAVLNDNDPVLIYAQQIYTLGKQGDVLIGVSTSGNAANVKQAVLTAKAKRMNVIGLTGQNGGWLGEHADIVFKVPAKETYRIQEYHLPIYHAICRDLEEQLFAE